MRKWTIRTCLLLTFYSFDFPCDQVERLLFGKYSWHWYSGFSHNDNLSTFLCEETNLLSSYKSFWCSEFKVWNKSKQLAISKYNSRSYLSWSRKIKLLLQKIYYLTSVSVVSEWKCYLFISPRLTLKCRSIDYVVYLAKWP